MITTREKLRTVSDWCLRGLGVFTVFAILVSAIGIVMQWPLLPPPNVKDIDSFREWRPDLEHAREMKIRGSIYYAVRGQYARPLPSSKSEYYFDLNGNYLGWNADPGDYKNPSLFFSPDAKYSSISIEAIPKLGHNKSRQDNPLPAPQLLPK